MSASRPQPVRGVLAEADFLTTLDDLMASAGSAAHPFVHWLRDADTLPRETMADVVHHLSLLYGSRPSLFEIVVRSPLAPAPEWLNAAMRAFAAERDQLTRLMAAAGPVPSRTGQTSVEESVNSTRNALLTLAGSDRLGCAIGAAAALLLDWATISETLDSIAVLLETKPGTRHRDWPAPSETRAVIETVIALPGGDRAVRFGFQTLLAQHHAFWSLLQSRETR